MQSEFCRSSYKIHKVTISEFRRTKTVHLRPEKVGLLPSRKSLKNQEIIRGCSLRCVDTKRVLERSNLMPEREDKAEIPRRCPKLCHRKMVIKRLEKHLRRLEMRGSSKHEDRSPTCRESIGVKIVENDGRSRPGESSHRNVTKKVTNERVSRRAIKIKTSKCVPPKNPRGPPKDAAQGGDQGC